MIGHGFWSYSPYRPLMHDCGDIYICRIAPNRNSIRIEWLDMGAASYSVYCKIRGAEDFLLCGTTADLFYEIDGLEEGQEYEFFVGAGEQKSRVRLARTATPIGTVVNYLHPDDEAYSFSGRCLCSPSLVRHPDGFLLASMDLYETAYPQNLTLIFRSDDDGKSWRYVSELMPCFWGKMFIHKGELYMLACSTEYGDLLIGRSTDGGKTFCAPVCLMRGSGGKSRKDGVHKNPQNIFIHQGRLYNTLEWGNWGNKSYYHAAMVMSCSVDDDLMLPENWHITEPVAYDPNWSGVAQGSAFGTIEGTLCLAPDGTLYNVMRYNIEEAIPSYGLALAYKVNTADPDAPLEYSHAIEFPCNHSKFTIKYDAVSKQYYSVATRIDCEERRNRRNLLSLMRSADLERWEVACDLIDMRHADMETHGFQYVDFEFEGDDIIFLCRSAFNQAKNFHDSNYSTFHRIRDFRKI